MRSFSAKQKKSDGGSRKRRRDDNETPSADEEPESKKLGVHALKASGGRIVMMRFVIGVTEEGASVDVEMMNVWIVLMVMQQVIGVALVAVWKA